MNSKNYYILNMLLMVQTMLFGKLDPEEYNKTNAAQFGCAMQEISKLKFTGFEKLLDIGSADGSVSKYIFEHCMPNGKLVGIDNNSDMVSFAVSHNNNENIVYKCVDAAEYFFENEYDVIVSFLTLHWIPNKYKKVLKNIAFSLKPGGQVLLCHLIGIDYVYKIAGKLLDTSKWNSYKEKSWFRVFPSLLQIASAIEESKLDIEDFEIKKAGIWMSREDIVNNWLSLSLFDFIPTERRKEYCYDIIQGLIKMNPPNEKGEVLRSGFVVSMVLKKPNG